MGRRSSAAGSEGGHRRASRGSASQWKSLHTGMRDSAFPPAFFSPMRLSRSPGLRCILPRSARLRCHRARYGPTCDHTSSGGATLPYELLLVCLSNIAQYHRNIDSSPGTATFQHGDFFAFDAGEGFDLGYDHTFLCALPPSLRSKWAARWIELLAQPGSVIITSIFPIDGPRDDGPPYAVTFELYDELLGGHFERLALFQPKEGGRKERQRMAIWRRK